MRTLRTLLLCATGFAVAWAQSQSTSQIQGTVQDASGAAVPGAQVTATQTDTGATRVVTTDGGGGYVLANLPIGPYRIEVTKQGFTSYFPARNSKAKSRRMSRGEDGPAPR